MRRPLLGLVLLVAAGGLWTAAAPSTPAATVAAAAGTTATSTPQAGDRLNPANRAALAALVAESPALDPAQLHHHDVAGHDVWGPVPEASLDPATQAVLDQQWEAAQAAATWLATPEQAVAAGYQKASAEAPGVGAHYVRWPLVDAPFDPALPSMLLYDESTLRPTRLAGFSYWVRSPGGPPEGFAGPDDQWHTHAGMCFRNGFLVGEDVPDPSGCDGDWLAGTDLWMLHAWVVPGLENPWGRFAPRNPAVCPSPGEHVADILRCPTVR